VTRSAPGKCLTNRHSWGIGNVQTADGNACTNIRNRSGCAFQLRASTPDSGVSLHSSLMLASAPQSNVTCANPTGPPFLQAARRGVLPSLRNKVPLTLTLACRAARCKVVCPTLARPPEVIVDCFRRVITP
jgi:hypothetical protein